MGRRIGSWIRNGMGLWVGGVERFCVLVVGYVRMVGEVRWCIGNWIRGGGVGGIGWR